MTRILPEVRPLPGQSVTVRGGPGLRIGYDKARTYMTVTAPGTYTIPPNPPTARVITSSDKIAPLLAQGIRHFVLHGGIYRESFGSVERHEADVSIEAFPGETVIFDGTGLAQNWLYLGKDAHWLLGDIKLQGFRPVDSGIIGVGDDCYLGADNLAIKGKGQPKSATVPWDPNSHGIYAHGSGTYQLVKPDITGIPGAALHHYRGTPIGTVDGGKLGAFYESAIVYSGSVALNGVAFVEPTAAWDIQCGSDATGAGAATLTACTGTGAGGSVRRVG